MRRKLSELDARFVGAGGPGVFNADESPAPERTGIGLSFKCPCGKEHDEYDRVFVTFSNPIDGGAPVEPPRFPKWDRTGDSIENITLTPSIQRMDENGCKWHGFVTNGEAHE